MADGMMAVSILDEARWYVACTQAMRERVAEENLKNQDFEVFLPECVETVPHPRWGTLTARRGFMFPGYIFVRFARTNKRWRSINGSRGVTKLFCEGDFPRPVPRGIVEDIIARTAADDADNGAIVLGNVLLAEPANYVVDQPMCIVAGVYASHKGLYVASARGRTTLLLDMLGGSVKVSLPDEHVRPV